MDWLPSRDVDGSQQGEPRVVGVDDGDISEVLDAISSNTARTILSEVYNEPSTASELSERADESIQTVSYHLENLAAAGLVAVADTRISDRGKEMNVYAPPDDPVVVFVGTEERKDSLLDLLKRVFGAGVLLLGATVYVLYKTFGYSSGPPGSRPVHHSLLEISFIAFFAGGLFVLVLVTLWGVWTRM